MPATESQKKAAKTYYQKNKEAIRARQREYYAKNKQAIRVKQNAYYTKNTDKINNIRKIKRSTERKKKVEIECVKQELYEKKINNELESLRMMLSEMSILKCDTPIIHDGTITLTFKI